MFILDKYMILKNMLENYCERTEIHMCVESMRNNPDRKKYLFYRRPNLGTMVIVDVNEMDSVPDAYDRIVEHLRKEFYIDTDIASMYPKTFINMNPGYSDTVLDAIAYRSKAKLMVEENKMRNGYFKIEKVIFNDPATIVFWADGTKTIVKAQNEAYDPGKGLAMAISKKTLGNDGKYFNEFKKWLPKTGDMVDKLNAVGTPNIVLPEELRTILNMSEESEDTTND